MARRSRLWRYRRLLFLFGLLGFSAFAGAAYLLTRLPLPNERRQVQTSFLTDATGAPLASAGAHATCTVRAVSVPSTRAGTPGADGRSWIDPRWLAVTARSGSGVPSVMVAARTLSPTKPTAGVSRTVDPLSAGPAEIPAWPWVTAIADTVSPRPIGSMRLDNAFTGLDRDEDGLARVELRDPEAGSRVVLWVDESHPYLMLYSGDTLPAARRRRGLAVEPMTCPPNAFRSGEGLIRLAPGESFTSRWGIAAAGPEEQS